MIANYYMEIIAFIVIISLIAILIFMKKNKEPKTIQNIDIDEVDEKSNDVIVDEFDVEEDPQPKEEETLETPEPIQTQDVPHTPEKTSKENSDALHGSEEGTFGEPLKQVEEEKPTKTLTKRDVPPHGKIVKDNFKEFSGTKILVAEDNLINQKVIRGLLDGTGIEITMADDGQEALDILEKNSDFTMILMDAHMPRVDGFEATRIIRANPNYAHIVVVALSGDTAADDIKKMSEAGMQEHLEKPLRMDAFYDILYAYTGQDEELGDDYVEVVMTKELNGDLGLSVCAGDEGFYREILTEFVTNYSKSSVNIHAHLSKRENDKADMLLLDITGIAANIGATNLQKIAQELKDAIQNNEVSKYTSMLQNYDRHLKLLLKDIKTYI